MTKQIFIWVGHPKSDSLCNAIGDAYQAGAERSGARVRRLNLSEMSFDMRINPIMNGPDQLEPDLAGWQDNITWADHLLFIHPYWWGAMPSRAKAVLDRALIAGFGYKYRQKGMGWDKLLTGKTADGIITSDTPPLIDAVLYQKPARRVLKNQVLGFCGIKTRKIVQFGSVKMASQTKIDGWIRKGETMGARAAV